MPTEERQLLFQPDEFLVAVQEYHNLRGELWVAQCSVAHVAFEEEPVLSAVITFSDDARVLNLTREMITASLIVYCINHMIPLPAEGQKSVRFDRGMVELVVTLQSGTNLPRRPDVFRTPESEFLVH